MKAHGDELRGALYRRIAAIVGGVIGLAVILADSSIRPDVALYRQWAPVLFGAFGLSAALVVGSAAMDLVAYLRRRAAARRRWYERGEYRSGPQGNT